MDGKTDDEGLHYVKVNMFGMPDPPKPVSFSAQLEVKDLDQQMLEHKSQWIVHPSEYYVGLFLPKTEFNQTDELEYQVVVSNQGEEIVSF